MQISDHHPWASRILGALASVLLVASASGCGGDDEPGPPERSATAHNEADVAFATDMVQHHAQALAMVDLTRGRDLDPEVQQLAEDVRTTQATEIETMVDWLVAWDEEVPATMRDHAHAGHGDGGAADSMEGTDHDMPGMASPEQMQALEEAPDEEFQTLWLEMMVEHHTGAVEMARTEQREGRHQPSVDLAGDVIDSQTEEIATMDALLGS